MKLWECVAEVTASPHPDPSRALEISDIMKAVLATASLEYACVHPTSMLLPSTVDRTSDTWLSYDKKFNVSAELPEISNDKIVN